MTIFEISLFGFVIAPTYYGLAYGLGFLSAYFLLSKRRVFSEVALDRLFLSVFLGVIAWGRLGYVLFYDAAYFVSHPLDILRVWNGGMSFHGGVIGVLLAMWYVARKERLSYLRIADAVTSVLPIWLALGRVANFLNNELFGYAPYSGPFAMVRNGVGHFPSPLLEALLEGPILFVCLIWISRRFHFPGSISSAFLVLYAVFRIAVEFVRLPDIQIGYLFSFVTMGQLLSLPMLAVWCAVFVHCLRKESVQVRV